MALVHNAELLEIIVDGGESAKSLNRSGMARLLALVDAGEVQTVIIAKLDRLTRSVKDLCTLLERFTRRGVALVSVFLLFLICTGRPDSKSAGNAATGF